MSFIHFKLTPFEIPNLTIYSFKAFDENNNECNHLFNSEFEIINGELHDVIRINESFNEIVLILDEKNNRIATDLKNKIDSILGAIPERIIVNNYFGETNHFIYKYDSNKLNFIINEIEKLIILE